MAVFLHDDVLDQALSYIQTNCDKVCVCSAQPTTATEAETTYMLANVTVDSGDFTIANGDTSGRKITMAQQADIPVTNAGDATHIAWVDSGTKVLAVTTCTTETLGAGNTTTIPAFDLELPDVQAE